ncbi:MAG: hypothetical protein SFX19_05490 [Alphaproteobacteria bacterium]|nr:hypothetical protein [Alphaproteobacteria bacterium]
MNDSKKPISAFDEICSLTIETMRTMDMETLQQLRMQAAHEFDRAGIVRGCLETAYQHKLAQQADNITGN